MEDINKENMKQVIVMRADLGMRKGKMIAQGAHASMKVTLENLEDERVKYWLANSFTKIVVRAYSEAHLLEIYDKAVARNLHCAKIIDNGLTEFNGVPTLTCIAIGPALDSIIDEVTGKLTLL